MKNLKSRIIVCAFIILGFVFYFNIESYANTIELNSLLDNSFGDTIVTSSSIMDLPLHYDTIVSVEKDNNEDYLDQDNINTIENDIDYNDLENDNQFFIDEEEIDSYIENNSLDNYENLEYNKEYIEWLNSSGEEREKRWGDIIPPEYIVPINYEGMVRDTIDSFVLSDNDVPYVRGESSLETKPTEKFYNLKNYINIPVEDQGNSGWCWNYSGLKALQTYFLKKGKNYNFAEYHLGYLRSDRFRGGWKDIKKGKYSTYGQAIFKEGDNYLSILNYFGFNNHDAMGPIVDDTSKNKIWYCEDDSKKGTYVFKDAPAKKIKVLRTVVFMRLEKTFSNGKVNGYKNNGNKISETDVENLRTQVKSQIKQNGAVTAYICGLDNSSFYNETTKSLYMYNPGIECNHAITIVGWNDNYSKSNFVNKPAHDGAWIALNSWGTSWGDNGYFYISYDDALVEKNLFGILFAEEWNNTPTVSNPSYSTKAKTNGNVTVTFTSPEKLQGISGWNTSYTNVDYSNKYYSIFTKESKITKTYTANATETITVKDESGKYVTKTVKITNIDKTAPNVTISAKKASGSTYSYNTNSWSNENVTLTVSASDANGIDSYSFDGGATWKKESVVDSNKYIVDSTKKVVVKVKDKVGNITTSNVQINIDKTKPLFKVTKTPNTTWSKSKVTLTVNATDSGGSGLNIISFDGGNSWKGYQGHNTKDISSTQTVNIKVKDVAGNISASSVKVNIDETLPVVSVVGNNGITNWVNKSMIGDESTGGEYLTIKTTDEGGSGAFNGYLYNKDGTNWINVNGTNKYYISDNETLYFKGKDNAGNISDQISVTINKVDKIAPTITSVKKQVSESKDKVTVKIVASDKADSKGIKSGISKYSLNSGNTWYNWPENSSELNVDYNDNQTINANSIIIKDLAGNVTKYSKEIIISEIDKTEFVANEPEYSNTSLTNKNVTVKIVANKKIKIPSAESGWTVSLDDESGKTIEKEYSQNTLNTGENVVLVDDNTGKTVTKNVKVLNIDKDSPIVQPENIIYNKIEDNKEEIIVIANEKIEPITDKTKGLKNTWSVDTNNPNAIKTVFDSSRKGNITIKDFAGNIANVYIEFDLISNTIEAQTIYKINDETVQEGTITNQPVTVIINADREIKPIEDWIISEDSKTISKTYNDYKEEEITIQDNYDNEIIVPVIANIDKEAPIINKVKGNPTKWTNKNTTLIVIAEDSGSSEELYYSFDGEESWSNKRDRTYSENEDNIQISVKDSAGNITSYNNINITKIDKDLPSLIHINKSLSSNKREVLLTIEAEDNTSGIKSYSFDGGNTWTENNSIQYSQNMQIPVGSIKVMDNATNVISYDEDILIDEIDETKFLLENVEYSTIDFTNQNVIVTISSNKELDPINGWTLSEDNKKIYKEYTENTREIVVLKEKNGDGVVAQDLLVNIIDKEAPKLVGEIEKSSLEYVKNVIVNLPDIEDEGVAGLREDGMNYSYDEGQTWTNEDFYTYNSNGIKKIYIRDSVNNILIESVEINNIDSEAPIIEEITGITGDYYAKDQVTVTINAHDNIELNEYAYSFDGGQTYQKDNKKTFTENNEDILIVVRDSAGNETKYNNEEAIKLKIDSNYPEVNITGIPTEWCKEATLTINAIDNESGIAGYSLDGKNYTDINTLRVTNNKTVNVRVKDNVGHITLNKITINKIDNKSPVINDVRKEVLEDSNKIKLIIDAYDVEDLLGIASGIKEYSFDGGITWSDNNYNEYDDSYVLDKNLIRVRDSAGNEAMFDKTITIELIDETELEVESVIYSTQSLTNKNVTVKIIGNKPIEAPSEDSGWKLDFSDEEGRTIIKEFEDNLVENVVLKDRQNGKTITETIEIYNIDKQSPIVNENNILYQLIDNNKMKVIVRANERIKNITDGTKGLGSTWQILENDPYSIYAEFTYSKDGYITIKDLVGNTTNVKIKFDLKAPEFTVNVKYFVNENEIQEDELTNESVLVTLESTSILKPLEGWTLSENNKILSRVYDDYTESIITVENYNDITMDIPIKVNIDKYYPSVLEVTGNPIGWTNNNVTLIINAQDNGSSEFLEYSFDGGNTWSTSNIKTYFENTDNINIKVRDSAGNISEYNQIINITKIDKNIPKINNIFKNTEEWTKEVIINVDAEDNESGIYGYSFDDLSIVPRPNYLKYIQTNLITITNNSSFLVRVKDNANNISEGQIININNIDSNPPEIININIESDISDDSNDIYLNIEAVDNESGLYEYSFDGGNTWISANEENSNKKKFNRNQIIPSRSIVIKDKVGNETYYEDELDLRKMIESIEIISEPTNKIYEKYEEPNLEGGKLLVKYIDGIEEEIDMIDNVEIRNCDNTKLGVQNITLVYQTKSIKMEIEYKASLKEISFENNEQNIDEGEEILLSVIYNPDDTTDDKTIVWSSSDDNKVVVDQNGKVTGIIAGDAIITATSTNGKKAQCRIIVHDITPPEITVTKNITEPTNKNVIINISSNEELQGIDGWILSNDKKSLSKEYENNIVEKIQIKDVYGNSIFTDIIINNIDKNTPNFKIKYGKKSILNNSIKVEISFDEVVNNIDGWIISKDGKKLTKEYYTNTEESVKVSDLAGNNCECKINVIIQNEFSYDNIFYTRSVVNNARKFIIF